MGQWCPEVKGDKGVERLIWEKFPTMHIWLNKIGQYWSGIWIIRLIFLSISFGSSHWSFYQFQMIFLNSMICSLEEALLSRTEVDRLFRILVVEATKQRYWDDRETRRALHCRKTTIGWYFNSLSRKLGVVPQNLRKDFCSLCKRCCDGQVGEGGGRSGKEVQVPDLVLITTYWRSSVTPGSTEQGSRTRPDRLLFFHSLPQSGWKWTCHSTPAQITT